jgi:hypothetical protein
MEKFSIQVNAGSYARMCLSIAADYMSSGTNSIFFSFYLFRCPHGMQPVGGRAGVIVTCCSTALFVSLGTISTQGNPAWNRVFIRSATLLVLGYVLTYWARAELSLRRKLELLREVSLTSNPRFGVDRTAAHFYGTGPDIL